MSQKSPDSHRTVLLATDRNHSIIGEVVDGQANTIGYSAYGKQSAQQDVETRLGFNGQLREANAGWYLLGNGYRAYNPTLMRFHSPDSWSPFQRGGLNAYMYCVGDPVNRSDPTGHVSHFLGKLGKFASGVDKFLFGGADVTGPSRTRALKASAPLGTMSPENTGEGRALAGIGTDVAAAPGARRHPDSMGLNLGTTTPRSRPGYAGGAAMDGLTYRTSRSIPQTPTAVSGSASPHRNGTNTPPAYEPPPSYAQATALWNADTFAHSQQPQTYTVNKMARAPAENVGAAAPYQAPAGAPPQPPALVVEQNQLLQGIAELNDMQRDMIQLRANAWRCRIL